MEEEVITLSSSEDEEYTPKVPLPSRTRIPRDDVQVIQLFEPAVILPKLAKHEPSKPNPSIIKVNGSSRLPVQIPDEDVILVSDSDSDEHVQTKEEGDILSNCPVALQNTGDVILEENSPSTELESSDTKPNGSEINGSGEVHNATTNGKCNEVEVLDDAIGSDDFQSDAATEIRFFLEKLDPSGLKSSIITRKEHEILTKKLWNRYYKLTSEPHEIHSKLAQIISRTTQNLAEATKSSIWTIIAELVDKFDAQKLRKWTQEDDESFDDEAVKRKKEEKKIKQIKHLEKRMNKISEKIKELDTQEVESDDSDNDHNSPYLQGERLKKKYMECFYLICEINKCSKLTGRPIQKRLDITKTTKYPEFEMVVQDLVNSRGSMFAPDYEDIYTTISKENANRGNTFNPDTVAEISKHVLQVVMAKIKSRRGKDLRIGFADLNDNPFVEDPADSNLDLAKKLEENRRIMQTEDEVVDLFAERQSVENPGTQLLEEENQDNSSAPSDNTTDNENASDGDDEDDGLSDTESSFSNLTEAFSDSEEKCVAVPAEDEPLFEDEEDEESGVGSQELAAVGNIEKETERTSTDGVIKLNEEVAESKIDEDHPSKKIKLDTALECLE